MNLKELVVKNRSYRRFDENVSVSESTLKELVDIARLTASARNQQSLKYYLSNNTDVNNSIFKTLNWAGYLKEWDGPTKGERPSAYIVILNDNNIAINHFCDEGITAQTILLGAVEQDLGGCIFGSINKTKLHESLKLSDNLEILLVLAIGKPIEDVVLEDIQNNDFKYWRDEKQTHHVPKRGLDEIVVSKTLLDTHNLTGY